ncbi:MAG TPA: hypothetical protein VN730_11055 [Steroidobacteraceae bacterium]|nr:hypothetical protein [Steroidobacteraceae bacterium]
MDPRFITPVLIAALVIWGLYRRARRFIGRQTLQPGRLWSRIGFLAVVGALVLVFSARSQESLGALLAGACCGAVLGWVGLKYTRFEATAEGRFYTPHAYIGLIVVALLVGRVLYRFVVLYSGAHGFSGAGLGAPGPNPFAPAAPYGDPGSYAYQNPYAFQRSPLTLAIFGTLVGYYISYYLGVLAKSRQPAIPEQTSGPG